MSDFFLWGGFVFSLFWHVASWVVYNGSRADDEVTIHDYIATVLKIINFGLSGVALCVFGYLAFSTL